MAEFDSAIALAKRLIEKKGRSVTLETRSAVLLDPAKPWQGSDQMPTQVAVVAVFVDFTLNERNNTLVQQGDKKCLIAAGSITGVLPTTQDRIVDGATNWEIVNVQTVQPGPVPILFKLQVRS